MLYLSFKTKCSLQDSNSKKGLRHRRLIKKQTVKQQARSATRCTGKESAGIPCAYFVDRSRRTPFCKRGFSKVQGRNAFRKMKKKRRERKEESGILSRLMFMHRGPGDKESRGVALVASAVYVAKSAGISLARRLFRGCVPRLSKGSSKPLSKKKEK